MTNAHRGGPDGFPPARADALYATLGNTLYRIDTGTLIVTNGGLDARRRGAAGSPSATTASSSTAINADDDTLIKINTTTGATSIVESRRPQRHPLHRPGQRSDQRRPIRHDNSRARD
jgi:hypothetical protein